MRCRGATLSSHWVASPLRWAGLCRKALAPGRSGASSRGRLWTGAARPRLSTFLCGTITCPSQSCPSFRGGGQSPRERPHPVLSQTSWFCRRGSTPAKTGDWLKTVRAASLLLGPRASPLSLLGEHRARLLWISGPRSSPSMFRSLCP